MSALDGRSLGAFAHDEDSSVRPPPRRRRRGRPALDGLRRSPETV